MSEAEVSFRVGDRVELASVGCAGVVEHADDYHVRVRWDDGRSGVLYYDGSTLANARHLLLLQRPR
jgi:uncharacterized protein YodC (DUF2158 family)